MHRLRSRSSSVGTSHQPQKFGSRTLRSGSDPAFTILEVLVAAFIASAAMAVLIPGLNRQLRYVRESSRMDTVDSIISRDLQWMRMYGRYWKLKAGPYDLSTTITKTSTYSNVSAALQYQPSASSCTNQSLAVDFLADAATLATVSLVLGGSPYRVESGSMSDFPGLPEGVVLTRTTEAVGNRLRVSYSLSGDNGDDLNLGRQASILLEASTWCDTLP